MKDLKALVARILGLPVEKISDSLLREDTPEWDSFNHLMLVSEVEKKFGVQIQMSFDFLLLRRAETCETLCATMTKRTVRI